VEITVFKMTLKLVSLRLQTQSDRTSMFSSVVANMAEKITEISACVSRQRNPNINVFCNQVISTFTKVMSFGATAPIWALAYLHETLRFTSIY
jgi:hypothetical protein